MCCARPLQVVAKTTLSIVRFPKCQTIRPQYFTRALWVATSVPGAEAPPEKRMSVLLLTLLLADAAHTAPVMPVIAHRGVYRIGAIRQYA